jgi:pyridoxine 5'-phosphate synthase PdxJ
MAKWPYLASQFGHKANYKNMKNTTKMTQVGCIKLGGGLNARAMIPSDMTAVWRAGHIALYK